MSQEYFPGKGKAPVRPDADATDANKPAFATVGSGSASEHATRLQNILDVDSGYGGSVSGEDHHAATTASSAWDGPSVRREQRESSAVHQMWYNRQRATLSRSIQQTLDLLRSLQHMNVSWPAHYPSVQRPELMHTQSMIQTQEPPKVATPEPEQPPPALRRSLTSNDTTAAESSRAAAKRSAPEPRLVSPQIAREFSILKLDLKLGALHQAELVHSLEKGSIASLLDGKISTSIKHLLSLRDRVEDTSSKILITGDLNAGKSTFCNALLRRKVLPEDQQPCTAIFCEVLDARENTGIEEVHAVHKDAMYSRNDETTYDVFSLTELENIVTDSETYSQCKVYVKDVRTIDESLLNNGVVDIAVIDAPGLNADTTLTTAIFARQEEIDVVVFVVSAANHFTQSAKEFILTAAAEKAYIFMVVNGFDTIRDQERCKKLVLDQVSGLSPRTRKESSELVHFVSSNAVPMAPGSPGGPSGSGSGSGSSSGGGDPGDDGDNGKGKASDKLRDFQALEQSLRRFVLEKRARSKLAPVRTYLLNILNDVLTLANVNQEVAKSEAERKTTELSDLEERLTTSKKSQSEVGDRLDQDIEDTCKEVYDHTRSELNTAITTAGKTNYSVLYPGLFSAFQYAEDLKEAMLSQIAESVTSCEDYGRTKSVQGVNAIKQLGLLHVGDEFQNLNFRPEVMFKRKRDALAREVDIPTELWDFVDWSTLWHRQEKFAGTGMALTVAGAVVPRMVGMNTWMDQALATTRILSNGNLRQLIIPGLVIAST